eukprot:gnl/TRDRNA2_/TRDRNA2_180438_c0_seq1.p1 gnl/TRDRNA2_/TRDRNA2_180438_c0~~gnl/TRDRNA2_/TRDRNA2_180438_c0_seq1.p1  ORF type:complete len:490 (+),score=162.26 gnl/TRDRNA2_/TRDRNA2_180438_c0_seq1:70-1539(+)
MVQTKVRNLDIENDGTDFFDDNTDRLLADDMACTEVLNYENSKHEEDCVEWSVVKLKIMQAELKEGRYKQGICEPEIPGVQPRADEIQHQEMWELRRRAESAEASAQRAWAERDDAKANLLKASKAYMSEWATRAVKAEAELKNTWNHVAMLEQEANQLRVAMARAMQCEATTRTDAESLRRLYEDMVSKFRMELAAKDEQMKIASNAAVETAGQWCDDLVSKFKAELAVKDEQIYNANIIADELRKSLIAAEQSAVTVVSPESRRHNELKKKLKHLELRAAAETLRASEAERQMQEMESTYLSQLDIAEKHYSEVEKKLKQLEEREQRVAEMEKRMLEMQEKCAAETKKREEKSYRCRDLQQDLENANRELKSCKSQLKQRSDERDKMQAELARLRDQADRGENANQVRKVDDQEKTSLEPTTAQLPVVTGKGASTKKKPVEKLICKAPRQQKGAIVLKGSQVLGWALAALVVTQMCLFFVEGYSGSW